MRQQGATGDHAIAKIAARQHGVVSYDQLRAAGLTGNSVARRVHAGRLHRIYRGVYAVGHAGLGRDGRWMAATLAYGEAAAVSHRSAAELWGLLAPRDGPVDISVPDANGKKQRKGIRFHRSKTLGPASITRRHGIPVTTPTRTIDDLRRVGSDKEVRRAIRQADVLGLRLELENRYDRTRSELELSFLNLCKRHRLPAPEVNVRIDAVEVDFLWPDQGLIVETDGYRYHRGRIAFESDRARDLHLRTLGYDVVRLTYRQVSNDAERIAALLSRKLRHR